MQVESLNDIRNKYDLECLPLTCSCDITYHLIIIIYLPLKIQMREMVLKPCGVNRTRHLPSMCTIYDYVIST